MDNCVNTNQQDQGELLEQLSQLRNELARKQKKLKKCRRSEKVKAHVKRKLQEQAQLNEDVFQNYPNKSLPSTLTSNSPASTFNHSSYNHSFEDSHIEDYSQTYCSGDKNTQVKLHVKPSAEKNNQSDLLVENINSCTNETYKTESQANVSFDVTKHEANVSLYKSNTNKLTDHAKIFFINKKCDKNSGSDKQKIHVDKNISDVSVKKSSNHDQEISKFECTNSVSVISSDNCILKSPSFAVGKRTDIGPDILSVDSSSEEICDLRHELKNDHKFLADSLAVTPSFVSTRLLTEEQDMVEGTEMPWHFDSELTDIKLRLNFNSESQFCDNRSQNSKYAATQRKECFANKDSQKVCLSKESESKIAPLHICVQNYDKLTCTPVSFCDGSTNELLSQNRSDVGVAPDNKRLKEAQSNMPTKKSIQPDMHKRIPDTSKTRCYSNSAEEADLCCKKQMVESKQIVSDDHHQQVDQSVQKSKTSPLMFDENNTPKSQTSSLPCIFRNRFSKVGRNLSVTRKRRRSNSFSDFSTSKKVKGFDDSKLKCLSANKSSDHNEDVTKLMENILMENTEKCSDKPDDMCYVISSQPENGGHSCDKRPTKALRNVPNSTVNKSDYSALMLESPDSNSRDSLSQSILLPALQLKVDSSENKELDKAFKKSDVSLVHGIMSGVNCSKNDTHQATDSKITGVGHRDGGHVTEPIVIDLTECLENEKSLDDVNAERKHCSQSVQMSLTLKENSSSDGLVSSSDDDVKIMEEISSESTDDKDNGRSPKHKRLLVGNYLDFTELDVIPFSQMELSESFLSDPEAYQTELMKGSCHGRKSRYNTSMFVRRKSPRLTSGIGGIIDGHNSQTVGSSESSYSSNSQLSLSDSQQLVSSRTRRSRKSLMISSLFQFLVDEARRNKSEEFFLPNIQYGCLLDAKFSERQVEASESGLKHSVDTELVNIVHACSEELYSQDCCEGENTSVCRIGTSVGNTTVDNQTDISAVLATVCDEIVNIAVFENGTKSEQKDVLPSCLSPNINEHVLQREDICNKGQKLPQSTIEDVSSAVNNNKTMTEVPCGPEITAVKISNVSSPRQSIASQAGGEKCLSGWNSEYSVLSPNRGSFHGDACLPSDCLSSQSSSETFSQTSSAIITEVSSKIHGKGCLRHVSCFQTGMDEPVLSLTSGTVMSNNEAVHFVACLSDYCVSLWSADKHDMWINELDWLLPLGCCAKNLWLLPHKTKAALLISGLKNESMSWVLVFVYHWESGESSRLSLDLPVTDLANAQNSLLCCPLMDNQVILSCNQSAVTLLEKYSLTASLGEISSQQSLEDTAHKLLGLSVVQDLNPALAGLSDNSHIIIWNHVTGTLLTQIDVSLVLPSPLSLSSVQAVKGYLFLLIMNRSFESPGSFLAVNPHIEMCKLLFHLDRCNGRTQSLKHSVVSDKIMAAVDDGGDIVLWDKYYGNLLAHLPQSHSTAVHLSKGLLFSGQENGCVHVMEIK